jgi:hypothetical protein
VAKGGFNANSRMGKNVATLASIAEAAVGGASSKQQSGVGDERQRRTEGERGGALQVEFICPICHNL